MATAEDIIEQALGRLAILRIGKQPSADQAKAALKVFNAMVSAWYADGVRIDLTQPLPDQHEEGLVCMLAMKLAPSYGEAAVIPPGLAQTARDGWERLLAQYVFAPDAMFESALRNLPSQRLLGQRGVPFNIASVIPDPNAEYTGFCTLTAGSPQTVVTTIATFTTSATVTLTPYTASAQDEWHTTRPTVVTGPSTGQFTITHLNNAVTDRTFQYLVTV